MRKLLIILSLVITGCTASLNQADWNSGKFKISNIVFEYSLPTDWTIFQEELSPQTVLLSQKNDKNFIILQQPDDEKMILQELYQEASDDFFYFKPISISDELLVFQGKPTVTSPLRQFHQKTLPITHTEFVLYGSCSFEFTEGKTSDCEKIINSWKNSVDK